MYIYVRERRDTIQFRPAAAFLREINIQISGRRTGRAALNNGPRSGLGRNSCPEKPTSLRVSFLPVSAPSVTLYKLHVWTQKCSGL